MIPHIINCNYHRNSWLQSKNWNWICRSFFSPFHPSKILHAEPCLINIDPDFFLFCLSQKFHGPLLPENYILLNIFIDRDWFDLSESHPKILCHDISYFPIFDLNSNFLQNLIPDRVSWVDEGIFLQIILDNFLDNLFSEFLR